MTREIKFRSWNDGEMHEDGQSKFWLSQGFEYSYMQYTGLLDSKGKEIYEGDIIRSESGSISSVGFADGCFVSENVDGALDLSAASSDESQEVIGNVWENPDLLK
jgi:uncharacterized phage protein (TIGR01671 family)